MNYVKLTPETFAEKLKANEYQDLTGARRAVGKASWPETVKARCRDQAEKFFGTTAGTKKPAATKAPVKKAAKAAKNTSTKASKSSSQPAETSSRPVMSEHTPSFSTGGKQLTVADIRRNPFQTIQLAEHGVQSGTSVLNALTQMKAANPTLDISEPTDAAVRTIKTALDLTALVIQNLAEGMEAKVTNKIAHSVDLNGILDHTAAAPTPGEPVYTPPVPGEA